jgi:hypothetical protein
VIEPVRDQRVREWMVAAMRAVLSDDNNYERGQAALRDVVDQIAREGGRPGLCNFAVGLSLELAGAFERIASDRGLAAADLAEVWLAE